MIARQYLSEEFIARLRRGIEEGEIITGRVQLTQNHEGLDTDIVLVEFEDHLGLILRDEMDYQVDWRNL